MKKFSYFLLGAAGLILASCSNEELMSVSTDGEANVSITLTSPKIQTRSFSDGKTAQKLQYAVYKVTTDASGVKTLSRTAYVNTNEEILLEKQVNFKLVSGHTYGFVFWAANEDAPYYVELDTNGATMSIDYNDPRVCANNEKLDAFFAYEELYVTGDQAKTINLYRPFAQINVGTSDLTDAEKAGYVPAYSHLTIDKVYKTLNLVTGEVSDLVDGGHDYSFSAIPSGETFPYTDKSVTPNVVFDYLTMVYALVDNSDDQPVVEVEFCTTDADAKEHAGEHTVGSVPVKRNYRTNIFGQLLTSSVDINVVIEPTYEEPDYLVNHDGVKYDAENKTYTITNAHGLEWLANRVNSHDGKDYVNTEMVEGVYGSPKCSFLGQKVVLANDIDMSECYGTRGNTIDFLFQPIGYETVYKSGASIYAFAGEFDGNNHTISNLKISSERNYHAALFGYINGATIKNLTIKDFDIQGHYKTAALVADARNSTIDNVTVTDGKVLSTPWEKTPGVWDDGNNAGGLVAYYDNQPLTGSITNCKVENVDITAYRRLGALAGRIGARDDAYPNLTCGIEIWDNTVNNVNLTADMTEVRYDGFENEDSYFESKAQIGGLFGLVEIQSTANPNKVQENPTSGITSKVVRPSAVVENTSELSDVLSSIEDGAVIVISGENVTVPVAMPTDKSYTLKGLGTENTLVRTNLAYNTATDAKITLQDLTLEVFSDASGKHHSMGFRDAKEVNLKNVNVIGQLHIFKGANANIEDCLFNYADTKNSPNLLWVETDGETVIKNCIFDHSVASLALLVCLNNAETSTMGDITLENCIFTSPQPYQSRAAVEIHSENFVKAGTLTMNNCKNVDNVFPSGLWREIVNSETSNNGEFGAATNFYTVIIDGKMVQDGTQGNN